MPDYAHAVFISYAWGGEREEIVNKIDEALHQRGIKIIRDKRDLGYKSSSSELVATLHGRNGHSTFQTKTIALLVRSDRWSRK